MKIHVKDGDEYTNIAGLTDDESNKSTVSPHLAERVVLNGIDKKSKIKPTTLQVALKENDDARSFTFCAHGLHRARSSS